MVVHTLLIIVLCFGFTLAEQTIFTNEEITDVFSTALNEFKQFSKRGNLGFPVHVPSTFTIQGKQVKLDYSIIHILKVYNVIVPDGFFVQQSQLARLKEMFQKQAKKIFPHINEILITQPTGIRSTASIKWPQDSVLDNIYTFTFSFPVMSDTSLQSYHYLKSSEVIEMVGKAFDCFKEFTEKGNQLGDAPPYSLFNFINYNLQLPYIIDDTENLFTAEVPGMFLVTETQVSIVENVLGDLKDIMPGSSLSGVYPQLVNGRKVVFIRRTASNNYEFRLSFHVASGHNTSLLLKLLAQLIQ